jgi:hypothetical protein
MGSWSIETKKTQITYVCLLLRFFVFDATRAHDEDDKNIRASDEFRLVRLNDIMVEFLRLSHDACQTMRVLVRWCKTLKTDSRVCYVDAHAGD